jgi:hypothetical protein
VSTNGYHLQPGRSGSDTITGRWLALNATYNSFFCMSSCTTVPYACVRDPKDKITEEHLNKVRSLSVQGINSSLVFLRVNLASGSGVMMVQNR